MRKEKHVCARTMMKMRSGKVEEEKRRTEKEKE
jgi:hypothetical protein